jgi:hypothetical protein
MKIEFLDRFSEKAQILNSTKILRVGSELFHAGGWTDGQTDDGKKDMMKLIVAFRSFANAPKKYY